MKAWSAVAREHAHNDHDNNFLSCFSLSDQRKDALATLLDRSLSNRSEPTNLHRYTFIWLMLTSLALACTIQRRVLLQPPFFSCVDPHVRIWNISFLRNPDISSHCRITLGGDNYSANLAFLHTLHISELQHHRLMCLLETLGVLHMCFRNVTNVIASSINVFRN